MFSVVPVETLAGIETPGHPPKTACPLASRENRSSSCRIVAYFRGDGVVAVEVDFMFSVVSVEILAGIETPGPHQEQHIPRFHERIGQRLFWLEGGWTPSAVSVAVLAAVETSGPRQEQRVLSLGLTNKQVRSLSYSWASSGWLLCLP